MDKRIVEHPMLNDLENAADVEFTFNGETYVAREGEPVAVALLAAGVRELRRSPERDEPRGLYCGIGHCYECRLWLGGTPESSERVRGCQVSVCDGDVYRSVREGDE